MALQTQADHLQIDREDDREGESDALDMTSLRTFLPRKRGLSKYLTGKSQSFSCISDVKCVEDLEKPEHRCAKRRKKYSSNESLFLPPPACRLVLSTPCRPCIGV